ncbi:prepilin-type N-terminal cleavage/methylation domain-containing protein [bacterium]|nr:prepilin-type N-terminal cleavage/methylation domain-containing protein [bacterium]
MKRAFTLLEILLVMSLVSLLMGILLTVVVRISRLTRSTTQASLRRKHWVEAAEVLRWQLRNIHVPAPGKGTPTNAITAGLVGTPDSPLWGEHGTTEGLDWLTFLSTQARRQKGVCEVTFCLQARQAGGAYDLAYREFPLRNRAGLHPLSDAPEAPWKVLLDNVNHLSVDYSEDGWIWSRDWTQTAVPRRIRVHLEARNLPVLDFQVTPGMGGGRW